MSSKKELERELDKIPPKPYKPTADLRRLHWLFHEAGKTNEEVPYSLAQFSTGREIAEFAGSIKPTHLAQALQLIGEIERGVVNSGSPENSGLVLTLTLQIYRDHYPRGKINHRL